MTPEELWQLARVELTPKQLEVYELRHRHRLSLRQIALALAIAVETVRARLTAADRRMLAAITREGDHPA